MWLPRLQSSLPGSTRGGASLLRMPSSAKHVLGRASPAKSDQRDSLEMDGHLLKCSCPGWDPGQCPNRAHPEGKACRLNKKKSRKHERCMARRTLERKGRPGPMFGKGTLPRALDPSKICTTQCNVWKVSQLTEEDAVKPPKNLGTLDPNGMVDTATQPLSFHNLKTQVCLPSSSAADGGSLPCLVSEKNRKCVAIDCEMVGTGPLGRMSELARCTVVNYNGDVIYDKYVRPELPILDYRTRWSGVTRRHMEHATPFRSAQSEVIQILRGKIVVGHAIHNDFRALKYFHPRRWTRDTSQSPLLREKAGLPAKVGVSLKTLARQLLHKKIQVSKKGHSSVEDAQTSMELYRLVEVQWEQQLANSLALSPPSSSLDSSTDTDSYMDDQYWPEDINVDCK